jgi:hypothetical protein
LEAEEEADMEGGEDEAAAADGKMPFTHMEVLAMLKYVREAKEVFKAWSAAKSGPAKTAALTALHTTRKNKATANGTSGLSAARRLDTLWGVITSIKTARWGRMVEALAGAMAGRLRQRPEAVFTRKIGSFAKKTRVSRERAVRSPQFLITI